MGGFSNLCQGRMYVSLEKYKLFEGMYVSLQSSAKPAKTNGGRGKGEREMRGEVGE